MNYSNQYSKVHGLRAITQQLMWTWGANGHSGASKVTGKKALKKTSRTQTKTKLKQIKCKKRLKMKWKSKYICFLFMFFHPGMWWYFFITNIRVRVLDKSWEIAMLREASLTFPTLSSRARYSIFCINLLVRSILDFLIPLGRCWRWQSLVFCVSYSSSSLSNATSFDLSFSSSHPSVLYLPTFLPIYQ